MVRGTVKAVVRATSTGRMLILRRLIEQTRPAEKQQRYNHMKMGSHLSCLCYTKVLCLERIIGKISSIIGVGLDKTCKVYTQFLSSIDFSI